MTSRILRSTSLATLLVAGAMAACKKADTPVYAKDGDTGAAAPATQQTLSPNPSMGDSTTGVTRGTGQGNMAGDTAGAFGKAAGATGAVPGKPTSGAGADTGHKAQTGAPRP